jgi:hypothetical protein
MCIAFLLLPRVGAPYHAGRRRVTAIRTSRTTEKITAKSAKRAKDLPEKIFALFARFAVIP